MGWIPATAHHRQHRMRGGAEHHVHHNENRTRVYKHTRNGRFGYIPVLRADGTVAVGRATARQYILRIRDLRKITGDDLRIEGAHAHDRGGLTISQPFRDGPDAPAPKIQEYMEQKGFFKVHPSHVFNQALADSFYFNPKTLRVVGDAREANMKLVGNEVHPLDLMSARVKRGSPFHQTLLKAIGR